MNILQIANYSAPYEGNFILSLKNLSLKLDNGNIVFFLPVKAKDINYNFNSEVVYYFSGRFFTDLFLLMKIIRKHNINLIHSHFPSSKSSLQLLIISLFFRQLSFARHVHDSYRKINIYKNLVRKVLRSYVDVFLACSEPVYHQLIEAGIRKERVFLSVNAIDFSRLGNYEEIEKVSEINIYMFGADWYRKGVDIAIKAVSKIENASLNIIISVSKEKVIDDLVKLFGKIPSFVKFENSRNDVATFYRAADVFIAPSRSEGFNYSLVEALYSETLVIASNINPHGKILSDEFLFESENEFELKQAILKVLKHKSNALLKSELKSLVVDKYNINKWSKEIIACFEEVLLKKLR